MKSPLLVPMNLLAVPVGDMGHRPPDLAPVPRSEDGFRNWYRQPQKFLPFEREPLPQLQPGIHLHWALPQAVLTTSFGEDDEKGEQAFIPNRWIVLRIETDGRSQYAAGEPAIRAWLIESDYLSDKHEECGTPFPFIGGSAAPQPGLGTARCGYVGRSIDLSARLEDRGPSEKPVWEETHPHYRFALTASGWGDLTFSHYYPACRNILGFHDDLAGVHEDASLSYLVAGWYSDPACDLLTAAQKGGKSSDTSIADRMANLSWHYPQIDRETPPDGVLLHGGVTGLTMADVTLKKMSGAPAKLPNIAIGGSAAEAFVAALRIGQDPDPDLERVLCAFFHDQAGQVGKLRELDELILRQRFSPLPGGARWQIGRKEGAENPEGGALPAGLSSLLMNLNEQQLILDRHLRDLEGARKRLFGAWSAWAALQTGPPMSRPHRSVIEEALSAVELVTVSALQAARDLDKTKMELDAALERNPDLDLTDVVAGHFLTPKDPYVVIDDQDPTRRDRSRPKRPIRDEGQTELLRCRMLRDVISGLELLGPVDRKWFEADLPAANVDPSLVGPDLAGCLTLLARELRCLDHTATGWIGTGSTMEQRELLGRLVESLNSEAAHDLHRMSWTGTPPDPGAVTHWDRDTTAGMPVFLKWQVRWMPAGYSGIADRHAYLQGAVPLSVISGEKLAANLHRFTGEAGNRQEVSFSRIETARVLGAPFAGFNELLQSTTLGLFVPPVDPVKDEIDTAVWDALGRLPQPTLHLPNFPFHPFREGGLRLHSLHLVDAFGRQTQVLSRDTAKGVNVAVAAAAGPADGGHDLVLERALLQPARLELSWLGREGRGSSPVHGWVVPNYLQKSFDIFAFDGAALGTLESVLPSPGKKTIQSRVTFKWRPKPGTTLLAGNIADEVLRQFVLLLTEFSADEGQAFLELSDFVLASTVDRPTGEDPSLGVLVGRPLAVVRAQLSLELFGLPHGRCVIAGGSARFDTGEIGQESAEVILGDSSEARDGLLGVIYDDHLIARSGAPMRLGPNSRIRYDETVSVKLDGTPEPLILLMQAGSRVHAKTELLPKTHTELEQVALQESAQLRDHYIRVAPVIAGHAEKDMLDMPRPSDAFGKWSFATGPLIDWLPVRSVGDAVLFDSEQILSEGWLRLQRTPPSQVKGEQDE